MSEITLFDLPMIPHFNPVVGPWYVMVVVKAVMLAVAVLLFKRAWTVRDWISGLLMFFLILGWYVNSLDRFYTKNPIFLDQALLTNAAGLVLYMTHCVLRQAENRTGIRFHAGVVRIKYGHKERHG